MTGQKAEVWRNHPALGEQDGIGVRSADGGGRQWYTVERAQEVIAALNAGLVALGKHPEPEITAREDMADFPVGTIVRDMIGRVFVRTDAQTYRWRTILGRGYDLSDDQATTYTPIRILWVPVGEGEQ